MKTQHQRTWISRVKALAHDASPETTRGAILGNLFQQIIVRIEEERKSRRKVVYFQTGLHGRFDISNSISERECHLLDRGRAGFANVIAADRNRVPVGHLVG